MLHLAGFRLMIQVRGIVSVPGGMPGRSMLNVKAGTSSSCGEIFQQSKGAGQAAVVVAASIGVPRLSGWCGNMVDCMVSSKRDEVRVPVVQNAQCGQVACAR
jgi:hypothetical protein